MICHVNQLLYQRAEICLPRCRASNRSGQTQKTEILGTSAGFYTFARPQEREPPRVPSRHVALDLPHEVPDDQRQRVVSLQLARFHLVPESIHINQVDAML